MGVATVDSMLNALSALQSPDNGVRRKAEETLNDDWLATHPDDVLLTLLKIAEEFPDINVSLIIQDVRRLAFRTVPGQPDSKVKWWDLTRLSTREKLSNDAVKLLVSDAIGEARNMTADVVASFASADFIRRIPSPELTQHLLQLATAPDANMRTCAFRIFIACPSLLVDHPFPQVQKHLRQALQDPDSKVRLFGLRATVAFASSPVTDIKIVDQCQSLMADMLDILPPLISANSQNELKSALEVIISLAVTNPTLFDLQISPILQFTIPLAKNQEMIPEVRQSCVELLTTLSEMSPKMCRKTPDFVRMIVPICLEWMSELDDEPEWYKQSPEDAVDDGNLARMGGECIDRLALALGGNSILPVAFEIIPPMLASTAWNHRVAALMAIAAVGEGTSNVMIPELPKVVNLILPRFHDSHARVQHAAIQAIGQLSEDFGDNLKGPYMKEILTSLELLLNSPEDRIKSHAAAACSNYFDNLDPRQVQAAIPFLDKIFMLLFNLISGKRQYVRIQALLSIGFMADAIKEGFQKYYSTVFPVLLEIMRMDCIPENSEYISKAMECASYISLAVGRDLFITSAKEFTDLLLRIQSIKLPSDDPLRPTLVAAWAKMAYVLRDEFIPFLPSVLPPLLGLAQTNFEIKALEDDQTEESLGKDYELIKLPEGRYAVNTEIIAQRITALESLLQYVLALDTSFASYVSQTLQIALPLLDFYLDENIRFSSASLISPVLSIGTRCGLLSEDQVLAVFSRIAKVFAEEYNSPYISLLASTLKDILNLCGTSIMVENDKILLLKIMQSHIQKIGEDRKYRVENQCGDSDDMEMLLEDENAENATLDEIESLLEIVSPNDILTFAISGARETHMENAWTEEM